MVSEAKIEELVSPELQEYSPSVPVITVEVTSTSSPLSLQIVSNSAIATMGFGSGL